MQMYRVVPITKKWNDYIGALLRLWENVLMKSN